MQAFLAAQIVQNFLNRFIESVYVAYISTDCSLSLAHVCSFFIVLFIR